MQLLTATRELVYPKGDRREQLRIVIQYLENNLDRMHYDK